MLFIQLPSGGHVYDPDTLIYLGNDRTQFNRDRRIRLDLMVRSLKDSGLWSLIYQLGIYAAPNSAVALRNLKGGNFLDDASRTALSPPNALPILDDWRGYELAGTSLPLIALSLSPWGIGTSSGGILSLAHDLVDDFSFGFWSLTDSQSLGGDIGTIDWVFDNSQNPVYSVGWAIEARNSSDLLTYRVNGSNPLTVANTNSKGLFIASRSSSSTCTISRNGTILATNTEPSQTLPFDLTTGGISGQWVYQLSSNDVPAFIGSKIERPPNNSIQTNLSDWHHPSGREYCCHWLGKGLTAAQQSNLFDILSAYLSEEISPFDLGI
jgi:hypothetical protein